MPGKGKQGLTAMTHADHSSRGQRDDMIEILRRRAQQSINRADMYLAYARVLLREADAAENTAREAGAAEGGSESTGGAGCEVIRLRPASGGGQR